MMMGALERAIWEAGQAGLDNQRKAQFQHHGLPPEQAREQGDILPYLKSLGMPFDVDHRIDRGQMVVAKRRRFQAAVSLQVFGRFLDYLGR